MTAGVVALAALPSPALAQNGFPDYRQAAADQYPAQPPPGNENAGSGGAGAQTGGSSGRPRPVHSAHGHKGARSKGNGTAGTRHAPSGGTRPVAVPTRPVPAARGSLPFTGSDLSGLVVLALLLIATGLLFAAASRAMRRRRRRAPA